MLLIQFVILISAFTTVFSDDTSINKKRSNDVELNLENIKTSSSNLNTENFIPSPQIHQDFNNKHIYNNFGYDYKPSYGQSNIQHNFASIPKAQSFQPVKNFQSSLYYQKPPMKLMYIIKRVTYNPKPVLVKTIPLRYPSNSGYNSQIGQSVKYQNEYTEFKPQFGFGDYNFGTQNGFMQQYGPQTFEPYSGALLSSNIDLQQGLNHQFGSFKEYPSVVDFYGQQINNYRSPKAMRYTSVNYNPNSLINFGQPAMLNHQFNYNNFENNQAINEYSNIGAQSYDNNNLNQQQFYNNQPINFETKPETITTFDNNQITDSKSNEAIKDISGFDPDLISLVNGALNKGEGTPTQDGFTMVKSNRDKAIYLIGKPGMSLSTVPNLSAYTNGNYKFNFNNIAVDNLKN